MSLKSSFLLIIITLAPLWISCGQFEGRLERDYSFFIESDDQGMTDAIVQIMGEFNQRLGANVLTYEPQRDKAGSVLKLERGIKARDDKVGWANYRIRVGLSDGVTTGRVRLDYDYVKENSVPGGDFEKLKTLTFHEIGHVFGLGHTLKQLPNARNQVMYASINDEEKDFRNHFHLLRQAYNKDSPEDVIYGSYD